MIEIQKKLFLDPVANLFWKINLDPFLIRACISEMLRGNMKYPLKYLSFYAYVHLKSLDLDKVSISELGLDKEHCHHFETTSEPAIEAIFNKLKITSNDAILDMGCGKGGALIILAKYPFRKLEGIDISPEMIRIGQNNLARLGITKIALNCCDACDFLDLDDFNYMRASI